MAAKPPDHWKVYLISFQPCTGLTALPIAYRSVLRSNKWIFIYNTSYITFPRLYNMLGYMILIGAPTQHHIPDHQPVAGYITAILASLSHYIIYIWCPTCFMFIAMLHPNLIYPLLLPSVLKCVVMHQLFMDIPEIYFLKFSMIYPFIGSQDGPICNE